jgi:chemotaxis protein CheY-P-specific phosphatase CheC
MDSYRELVNVAMGRAGDLLARVLGRFVELSIPNVNLFEGGELRMTLSHITGRDTVHAVSQGFVARDLAGEAMVIFNDASFDDLGRLLGRRGPIDDAVKTELLMDVANLLIGACLKGISEQLERPFSECRPAILGQNARLDEMLAGRHSVWRPTLAVEVGYRVEEHDIQCELLLLFTQDSLPTLDHQLAALGRGR